jgi:hypothetical protein
MQDHAGRAPSHAREMWRVCCQSIVIIGLTFLAYLPVLSGGFIWDDDRYLTENPLIWEEGGLHRIWFSMESKDYYPVLYTALWLESRLWEKNPAPYHAFNIALHAAVALLLWRLLTALGVPGAYYSGLLFALHPINVESVAWISQQKNTLAMFLFLASVWSYLKHDATRRVRFYWSSLLLFLLSLLAKPIAIAWPIVIVALEWWRYRRLRRKSLQAALVFGAVSAVLAAITIYFQYTKSLGGEQIGPSTLLGVLSNAMGAWCFYIHKALVPVGMCAIYPGRVVRLFQPAYLALLVMMCAGFWVLLRAKPGALRHVALGLIWYTAMLLPVLGIAKIGFLFYSPVSDHWAYAAMPAVFALGSAAGVYGVRHRARWVRVLGGVLAMVVLLALLGQSYSESRKYVSDEMLFRDAVAKNPDAWAAHVKLGNLAFRRQDLNEAEQRYTAALRLKPDYWEAINGLGIVAAIHGDYARAISHFEQVIQLKPNHASACQNLQLARQDYARQKATPPPSGM